MEISIRKHLTENGYFGGSAKLRGVRLVAVQRPGWQQVFRFDVTARVARPVAENAPDLPAEYHDLFGLVRDDIRHGTSVVRVFSSEDERRSLFTRWSEDMIRLRGAHGLVTDA